MQLIERGFTERQIYEDFSVETLGHFRTYLGVKNDLMAKELDKTKKGDVAHRQGGKVTAGARSAW